jgi:hypothetical protein
MQKIINKRPLNNELTTLNDEPAAKRANNTQEAKKFFITEPFDGKKNYEVHVATDYNGNKVPMLKIVGSKKDSTSVQSSTVSIVFADMSENGDVGKFGKTAESGKFNISVEEDLSEKINKGMPAEQARSTKYFQWFREIVDEMFTAGWEHQDVWKKWKAVAEKKAKKKGETRTADQIFKEDASLSMFKSYEKDEEDIPMFAFSTKYQKKFGGIPTINRPQVWRKKYAEPINITDELPHQKNGLYRKSGIRCMVELVAYNTDTKYGIRAELGPNILAVLLEKGFSKSVTEMVADVVEFDDEGNVVPPPYE